MDHARARGLFTGDNPTSWRGGLRELLPARSKLTRGHHAAAAYKDMPAIMAKLRASGSVSARAVEFTALTASRSGEVRGAVWSEIDFAQAVWIVPAERMKAGREHRVPLTGRMLAILEARKQVATRDLVFEGGKEGAAISDTAMVKSLRAASEDKKITLHGLRSSFRDWAGDTTSHPREVAEADMLKFQKSDGYVWYLTISGFRPGGVVDAMYYDGLPHPFLCTLSELNNLRIVEITTISREDVQDYRAALGMDPKLMN